MHNYILGVINKETNKYENIVFVDKSNKYKCIACESDLILRKGDVRFQSFVHKNKNKDGCQYFKHPTQAQLIRDAKMQLQVFLEQNKLDVYRRCRGCKTKHKMIIPTYDKTKSVKLDEQGHDVVYLDETNNMICGFTMGADPDTTPDTTPDTNLDNKPYTNKTPENYKINMKGLIHTCVLNFATKKIELLCDKKILCHECASILASLSATAS